MNFKRQQRESLDVNLTPLIDIVFLLLIFFMVSTTFTKEHHLSIDLPESSSTEQAEQNKTIEISITAEGTFAVDQKVLINSQIETLKRALRKSLGDNKQKPVMLTADAKTPHSAVVMAMDAAGQLGLVNISITTKLPSNRKP